MRQDQFDKLQALSERLTDVFLGEAEPDKWPGHGIEPQELTQEQRGDRYWSKKNAVATLTLITKVTNLTLIIKEQSGRGAAAADEADSLDEDIKSAEKEASKLLDDLQRGDKKIKFDKKVHGKA